MNTISGILILRSHQILTFRYKFFRCVNLHNRLVFKMKISRLFLCPDIQIANIKYPITGRKGSEFYAIYRTRSRAGSKEDGLIDLPEKL